MSIVLNSYTFFHPLLLLDIFFFHFVSFFSFYVNGEWVISLVVIGCKIYGSHHRRLFRFDSIIAVQGTRCVSMAFFIKLSFLFDCGNSQWKSNLATIRQMLKKPSYSSDLHFSGLHYQPERGTLTCSKICSKKL